MIKQRWEHHHANSISLTIFLVEVTQNLTTSVFSTCFVVIQNAGRCCQNNDTERTSRQQLLYPGFNTSQWNVEARRDNTTLVDTSQKLNNNLSASVVVNEFVFTDVTWRRISKCTRQQKVKSLQCSPLENEKSKNFGLIRLHRNRCRNSIEIQTTSTKSKIETRVWKHIHLSDS